MVHVVCCTYLNVHILHAYQTYVHEHMYTCMCTCVQYYSLLPESIMSTHTFSYVGVLYVSGTWCSFVCCKRGREHVYVHTLLISSLSFEDAMYAEVKEDFFAANKIPRILFKELKRYSLLLQVHAYICMYVCCILVHLKDTDVFAHTLSETKWLICDCIHVCTPFAVV